MSGCWSAKLHFLPCLVGKSLPAAHLIHQHISHPLDEKVLLAFIHQRLLLPLQDPLEELAMDTDQLVQAGEQLLHRLLLEEQLGHHPAAVHIAHDLQRPDVVQLGLHQLWRTTELKGQQRSFKGFSFKGHPWPLRAHFGLNTHFVCLEHNLDLKTGSKAVSLSQVFSSYSSTSCDLTVFSDSVLDSITLKWWFPKWSSLDLEPFVIYCVPFPRNDSRLVSRAAEEANWTATRDLFPGRPCK